MTLTLSHAAKAALRATVEDVLAKAPLVLDETQIEHLVWGEGLLTASAIGPKPLSPEQRMSVLWPDDTPDTDPDMRQVLDLLQRQRYTVLCEQLEAQGPAFQPQYLDVADETKAIARTMEWADGFIRGVALQLSAWQPLFEAPQPKFALAVILAFGKIGEGGSLFPEIEPAQMLEAQREALPMLGAAIYQIKAFWDDRREDARRHGGRLGKIGRNEPCPCGSGQKYKKCCLN